MAGGMVTVRSGGENQTRMRKANRVRAEEMEAQEQTAAAWMANRFWYRKLIDFVKEGVGEGAEYVTDLVRVVLSERGCYYQFHAIPEEFSGALGSGFNYQYVGSQEGLELFARVQELVEHHDPERTPELSLLAVYDSDFDHSGAGYQYHFESGPEGDSVPIVAGHYRPGVLPLFLKLRVHSDTRVPMLGSSSGVLFFVANATDQHLIVRIPHQGLAVADLAQSPQTVFIH